ncbi:MAG: SDR family NAD(P)-dependent oxidoreductase [Anaerolineales bacterium]|nr:SDR family NAD(P)-dependent oxidoreductase [Anaerolineales bacterium]
MTKLRGKYVLLTGGSRGLGPLIAEALAQRGAHLALAARSEEGLRNTLKSLEKHSVKTLAAPVDLAQPGQPEKLIAAVMQEFGAIDILVNNAGLETEGAYTRLEWAPIRQTVEVNLLAPMALAHLVLPQMLARRDGHIVNIASVAARSGGPYAATYSATKAGMAEWTHALRLEYAGSGVHFSAIFPGYVTEVGMFARFNLAPPWMVGSCTPVQVARAVVRAIEKEQMEVIVNSRPARLLFISNVLSPTLGDWLMRSIGAVDFQRRKAGL